MTTPDPVIDRYLTAVAAGLTPAGPARLRRSIVDELRDGLLEACAAYQAHSLTPIQAAAAAAASLIRLVLGGRASRRCLATRATLT